MLPRERIIENENLILSEYACKSTDSRGRRVYEKPCDFRTDFQRDRDRIIHCNSFRRLKLKTQVFLIPHGDHYRTRLTHTLEVSQIARTAACSLGLNEALTEAIALGHDLGHTPFGHDGERVLNKLLPNGFAHNLQSKRVVEVIEKDGKGLNLTYEVIDGIVAHRGNSAPPVTREGWVVRLCDKIAYINHDIEDAVRGGVISQSDLPKYPVEFLGDTKSKRITSLVRSLVENSGEVVRFDDETARAFAELRDFMFERVYTAEPTVAEKDKAGHIVEYLFEHFFKHQDELPALYQQLAVRDGAETAVGDFISGMSDEYAIELFSDLCIPRGWGVK